MASFPQEGDTYDSIKAFKVAVQTACYYQGVRMSVESSATDQNCVLGCPLSGARVCSAGFTVRLVPGSQPQEFRVVRAREQHGCGRKKRRRDAFEARELAAKRLENLGVAVPALSSLDSDLSSDDSASDSEDSAQPASGSTVASSSKASAFSPAKFSPRRASKRSTKPPDRYGVKKSRTDEEEEEAESDSSEPGEEPDAGLMGGLDLVSTRRKTVQFPSREDLHDKIQQLAKSGLIALPAIGVGFSSLETLLITLHTVAAQNGFYFTRRCGGTGNEALRMECRKSHDPLATTKCRFHVKAKKDGKGWWVISDVHSTHSHRLEEPRVPPAASSRAAPTNTGFIQQLPKPFFPSAIEQPSPVLHPPRPSGFVAASAKPNSSPLSAPSAPTALDTTPANLSAFLLSFNPSLSSVDLTFLPSFFSAAGISTVGALAELVRLEDETVISLVQGVRDARRWTPAEEVKVLQILTTMRERFAAET